MCCLHGCFVAGFLTGCGRGAAHPAVVVAGGLGVEAVAHRCSPMEPTRVARRVEVHPATSGTGHTGIDTRRGGGYARLEGSTKNVHPFG